LTGGKALSLSPEGGRSTLIQHSSGYPNPIGINVNIFNIDTDILSFTQDWLSIA
jgi:hypothetical protein